MRGEKLLQFGVNNRRPARIEHIDPCRHDVDRDDFMMLGQQDGIRKPDIAQAENRDLYRSSFPASREISTA